MVDKRIQKTKQKLKKALTELLQEQAFDQITVTELCSRAEMSRITFYSHYPDKYALLDGMMQELFESAFVDFETMQRENNPEGDPRKTYFHLLDCILNLYESDTEFLRQASQKRNPFIYYAFYQRVFHRVEDCFETQRELDRLAPQMESRKFSSFICTGLWAYINECSRENDDLKQIRRETHALLSGILDSQIFSRPESGMSSR